MKRLFLIVFLLSATVCGSSLLAQETKPKQQVENERPAVELTVNGNRVTVQNALPGQLLEVFSVVGLKVEEITIKSSPSEFILNVPKGYYILKIGDTVRKVAVK